MSQRDATRDLVWAALKRYQPVSTPELAKKLDLLPATINWHIQSFRDEHKVYVKGFSEKRGKTHTRIWAIGQEPDARRTKFDRDAYYFSPRDEAEDKRITKQIQSGRLSDDQIDAINAARDAKRRAELLKHIKPFRDPMIWALFGGIAA